MNILNRDTVRVRLINAFDGSQDDPLGAMLSELAKLNEEAMLAAQVELMDAPDNQPSAKAQTLPPPLPQDTPIEEREWDSYGTNPYHNPAACGLRLIAVAEDDEPWEFNLLCLWQDLGSGRYFVGTDSGCSCPSPFEDVRSVSDLTEVRTQKEALSGTTLSDYTTDSATGYLRAVKENLPRW